MKTTDPKAIELMTDALKASKLSDSLELLIKTLAADDRRWSTQETVEYNLRSLAQHILYTRASHPRDEIDGLKYALQIARRDIGNWITHEDARDTAIAHIDKYLKIKEGGE